MKDLEIFADWISFKDFGDARWIPENGKNAG
jgi:hypothetical protein